MCIRDRERALRRTAETTKKEAFFLKEKASFLRRYGLAHLAAVRFILRAVLLFVLGSALFLILRVFLVTLVVHALLGLVVIVRCV